MWRDAGLYAWPTSTLLASCNRVDQLSSFRFSSCDVNEAWRGCATASDGPNKHVHRRSYFDSKSTPGKPTAAAAATANDLCSRYDGWRGVSRAARCAPGDVWQTNSARCLEESISILSKTRRRRCRGGTTPLNRRARLRLTARPPRPESVPETR